MHTNLLTAFGLLSFCRLLQLQSTPSFKMKFIDIGANLKDGMYRGIYNGKTENPKHEPDLEHVLRRAWDAGLHKIIITGTNVADSQSALNLAQSDERLYSTVGCHPTQCTEYESDPKAYSESLDTLIREGGNKVVAFGEFGLDYDRLQYCPKETQLKFFEKQLNLSLNHNLPLFLHCRNAEPDFMRIIREYAPKLPRKGVVHSFDGTTQQAIELTDLGFYIGINGCSLKTVDNLEVLKSIPEDRLLLETDCPWCEVKQSHAGHSYVKTKHENVKNTKWQPDKMVKSRNEPANIVQILEIVAAVRGVDEERLGSKIHNNTLRLFFPHELPHSDTSTHAG
uniref:Deoxyribonuclease TATDN1 n=1 Tax=Cacopsylla melanoneura TaxID=428564 RepID=A0A8D8QEH2_9HEMI